MTGGSPRLIAVQAVVVGLLLVVVFATLLQPESESPIESIEGKPGRPRSEQPGDANPGGNGPGENRGRPGGGGTGSPGGGPGGAPGGAGPGGGGPAGPGAPGTPPSGTEGLSLTGPADGIRSDGDNDTDNPSTDQYVNALAQLAMRLN